MVRRVGGTHGSSAEDARPLGGGRAEDEDGQWSPGRNRSAVALDATHPLLALPLGGGGEVVAEFAAQGRVQ